jgi:hypothetical protein
MDRVPKERRAEEIEYNRALKNFFILFFVVLFYFSHCHPSRIFLSPPSQIESIEGYASIRMMGDRGSVRSKFSFLFHLPHQAKVTVSDFLGKGICEIIVEEERAVFVIPSKRVYWQGDEGEIIDKFLGFRMNLEEMISLLRGEWKGERGGDEKKNLGGWSFKKDEAGRIIAGQRGELHFEVKEFFAQTAFARLVGFEHPLNRGSLKILGLSFNQPLKKESFSLSFLERYERKSWEEIEKILGNES